jgi:plasmid stabilization system protein ParE
MAKLVWSEEAFNDLDDITDFILKDSARYAQIVGEALLTAAKEAFEEPYVGRMVP